MTEQILDAAEDLFSKHGLYGVTLKDVAKRIGVHHTLLNYYFPRQEEAVRRGICSPRSDLLRPQDEGAGSISRQRPKANRPSKAHCGPFWTRIWIYTSKAEKAGRIMPRSAPRWPTHPSGVRNSWTSISNEVVLRLIELAPEGTTRCQLERHLLELSLRHWRADAYSGAYGAHRQAFRRPLQFRQLIAVKERMAPFHGRGIPRRLRVAQKKGQTLTSVTPAAPCGRALVQLWTADGSSAMHIFPIENW